MVFDKLIPPEALTADAELLRQCDYDFARMSRQKQQQLMHNRLSVDRINSSFGRDGKAIAGVDPRHIAILIEFATFGITPPVSPLFRPTSTNIPPLQDRNY